MEAELNKIVVEVIKEESVIKKTETSKTAKGKIISRGEACTCKAQVGDTVLFSGFAGANFEHEGTEYLVLNENEIFVKL